MKKLMLLVGFILVASTLVGCIITSDHEAAAMPVGEISQQQLLTEHQSFSDGYQDYVLNAEQVAQVKQWPEDLSIDVFFGTWCHDSQREVPRLLKINQSNHNVSVNLIALDYNKVSQNNVLNKIKLNIRRPLLFRLTVMNLDVSLKNLTSV